MNSGKINDLIYQNKKTVIDNKEEKISNILDLIYNEDEWNTFFKEVYDKYREIQIANNCKILEVDNFIPVARKMYLHYKNVKSDYFLDLISNKEKMKKKNVIHYVNKK